MKNITYVIARLFIAVAISAIQACTYGEFEPHRERLHSMGNDICQEKPESCINGIPW